jgi:transcriptional antiterminator NusG
MSDSSSITGPNWYAVQTLSNQEGKAKKYLDKFIAIEEMDDFVFDVLMPTEQITEVKAGKKSIKTRKFYPGYIFVNMRLYDDDGNLLQKPWYFVREGHGVINFVGGDRPTPLKKSEIDRILNQVEESEGKESRRLNMKSVKWSKSTKVPSRTSLAKLRKSTQTGASSKFPYLFSGVTRLSNLNTGKSREQKKANQTCLRKSQVKSVYNCQLALLIPHLLSVPHSVRRELILWGSVKNSMPRLRTKQA